MSNFFANARAWLAAIDPLLPAASLVLVVFAAIYSIRRWLPNVWVFVEKSVPFVDSLDYRPFATVVWKAWQALPGALLGAVVSALSSGLNVKSAVVGVLAGFAASVAHEVMAAYKGQVGARTAPPGGPFSPTLKAPRSFSPPPAPPSSPTAALRVLGATLAMMALLLGGCAWLKGTAWPVVKDCAPTPATLLTQVETVLLDGSNVKDKLGELAQELGKDGWAEVVCAVKEFEAKSVPRSARYAAAQARGRAFLVETGNAQ